MNAETCPHDDDPALCPPCQVPPHHRVPRADVGPPFTSRYDGDCKGCGGIIEVGERIRAVDRGHWTEYRHDDPVCLP